MAPYQPEPDSDQQSYWHFTGLQRIDKALHSLDGLVRGVTADSVLQPEEIDALDVWLIQHEEHKGHPILGPLMRWVRGALRDPDGPEYLCDAAWRLRALSGSEPGYYDSATQSLQCLHGLLAGISADGVIQQAEIERLQDWLFAHTGLQGSWPFDEICSVVTQVLADGHVSSEEQSALLVFFQQFGCQHTDAPLADLDLGSLSVSSVCCIDPAITFRESSFVVTGRSQRGPRRLLQTEIETRGGVWQQRVTRSLDYLIVCADRNKAWAYEAFGRKVEQALNLRRNGQRITLIHENDFWDAVADAPIA